MNSRTRLMIVVAALGAVWMVGATLNGQAKDGTPEVTRTGVVNLIQVFNEFDQTKALNRRMKEYQSSLQQQKAEKDAQLADAASKLQALRQDSAEWAQQNRDFMEMRVKYQVWGSIEEEALLRNHRMWTERTYDAIVKQVEQVALRRGFHIVITEEDLETKTLETKALLQQIFSRKVVYSHSSVDITDEVLQNLNAAFEKAGGADSVKFAQ